MTRARRWRGWTAASRLMVKAPMCTTLDDIWRLGRDTLRSRREASALALARVVAVRREKAVMRCRRMLDMAGDVWPSCGSEIAQRYERKSRDGDGGGGGGGGEWREQKGRARGGRYTRRPMRSCLRGKAERASRHTVIIHLSTSAQSTDSAMCLTCHRRSSYFFRPRKTSNLAKDLWDLWDLYA